ncbi:MAG: HNH endonuclease [Armatimonadota bacterium]
MSSKGIATVGEYLYWSYANLGMAHAALSSGAHSYGRVHYIIRNKLYRGLVNGTMHLGSLKEDERLKLVMPQACCYCGSITELTLDHLIPTSKGGKDTADNIVWACKSCNSSKGAMDVLEWHEKTSRFPSVLLLRRYLKLVIEFCDCNGLMESNLNDLLQLPFSLRCIPQEFPELNTLKLWVIPICNGSLVSPL